VRWILRGLLGLILLAVVAAGLLIWRIDAIARRAVEQVGSEALGVPIRLGLARIGFAPPGVTLSGLEVANPPGWSEENFLRVGRLALAADPESLRADVLVVPRIEVSGVEVALERRLRDSNYGDILAHLKRGAPPEPAPEPGRSRACAWTRSWCAT
jgi:uncharacterized protein involved in outer membrane biogenesis